MNISEELRIQTVEAVRYLQNNGFEEKYLSRIHHNGTEKYSAFFKHWDQKIKKITSSSNFNFAFRVIFITDEHKKGEKSFFKLCNRALEKYP